MQTIEIKGAIIPDELKDIYDMVEFESTCPADIKKAIEACEDEDVTVVINSGGGEVYAGNEIYYLLKNSKKNITIDIVYAASAASVIAMAGYSRIIPSGVMMIHNVACSGDGDHREHEKTADMLKVHDRAIAQAYMDKTGLDIDTLLGLMENETYLTSADCIKYGFVDAVISDSVKFAACDPARLLPQRAVERIRALQGRAERGQSPDTARNKNRLKVMRMKSELSAAIGQPP